MRFKLHLEIEANFSNLTENLSINRFIIILTLFVQKI